MNDAEAEVAVLLAIEAGYRLVDTAENYMNEVGVGRGIRTSGVARDEMFVTTKFNKQWHSAQGVRQAFEASCVRLGVDYIDLLLIHWPNPSFDRYVEAFAGLAELQRAGHLRAVGTSNFKPSHLDRVYDETGLIPDVNQIELSPRLTRDAVRAYHTEHGIITQSWSPLGRDSGLLAEPAIAEVAARHGKTPAQVVLRWHVELGLVAVPKSASAQHIQDNIDIFDFELDLDDIAQLSTLDKGEAAAVDADSFGH